MPLFEYECIQCRKNVEDSLKAIKKGVTKKLVSELVKTHANINHIGVLWPLLAAGLDTLEQLLTALQRPRSRRSFGEHLRRTTGLSAAQAALVFEVLGRDAGDDLARVVDTIKRLPLRLLRARPIAEVISSAGGVRLEALDDGLMLRQRPGVFCAGEMLDWEAPTGGYLLQACFASGLIAGRAAAAHTKAQPV